MLRWLPLLVLLSSSFLDGRISFVESFTPRRLTQQRGPIPTSTTATPGQRYPTGGFNVPTWMGTTSSTSLQPQQSRRTMTTTTSLSMSFQLPPSPDKRGDLTEILKLAGSLLVGVLFFISPLGGLVLGIFNSIFLLVLFLPILATIGFSTWQYFNTISGTCPNCGSPVTVLKNPQGGGGISSTTMANAQPSICFNCGSILQANYDNTGIENITGRNTIQDLEGSMSGGFLDSLFGRPSSSSSASSGWMDATTAASSSSTTTKTTSSSPSQQQKRVEREATIIDVEIDDDDDKPWQ